MSRHADLSSLSIRKTRPLRLSILAAATFFGWSVNAAENPLTLTKPIEGGRFASGFGYWEHPLTRKKRFHTGVDWAAPEGTPIHATGSGTIQKAGPNKVRGLHIEIRHAGGYVTTYSQMSKLAPHAKPGTKVSAGDVIGYVGSTGRSTGPHVHYEVHINGSPVDPMKVAAQ